MNQDDAGRKADAIIRVFVMHGIFAESACAVVQGIRREIIQALTDSEPFALALTEPPQPNDWPKDYQEQFWSSYPRRIGKDATMRRLDTIRKSGAVRFAKVLDAVYLYRHKTQNTDMKYIAHPATWLSQGRWKDDPNAIAGHASDGRGEVKNGFIGRLIG